MIDSQWANLTYRYPVRTFPESHDGCWMERWIEGLDVTRNERISLEIKRAQDMWRQGRHAEAFEHLQHVLEKLKTKPKKK